MRFNHEDSRRAGSKRTGKAGATIGVLLLLGGCASFHTFHMSSPTSAGDEWLTAANVDNVLNARAAKGMMPAWSEGKYGRTMKSRWCGEDSSA